MILDLDEELKKQKRAKQIKNAIKWKKENPEKVKKIQSKACAKYKYKNREKINQINLNYYYRNREKILQKMKEKYQEKKKGSDK